MRRQQRPRARSMAPFYAILAAVALGGVGLLVWLSRRQTQAAEVVADTARPALGSRAAAAEPYLYGKPDAPVTILEFADFECPVCGQWSTITEPDVRRRILDAGLANLRFYDFPLSQHRFTMQAATAAACAADQGRFWEMHDHLLTGQEEWSSQFGRTRNPKGTFERYAREVGLDVATWSACYESSRHRDRIEANRDYGLLRGVNATPTFIIGNQKQSGALPYDMIKSYVDAARAAAATAAAPKSDRASNAAGGATAGARKAARP